MFGLKLFGGFGFELPESQRKLFGRGRFGGSNVTLDDFEENFLAVDTNVLRGRDPQPDTVSIDANHSYGDVSTDPDRFVQFSRKDQHGLVSVRNIS